MNDLTSVTYTIHIHVQIDFAIHQSRSSDEESVQYLNYLYGLKASLGDYESQVILYENPIVDSILMKNFFLKTLIVMTYISFLELQLIERLVTTTVNYWNTKIFRYNGKFCSYSIEVFSEM